MRKINQLKQLEMFKNVSSETMETLAKAGKISQVEKGTNLIRAKEPVSYVYFQISGKSIIYNLTHTGKRKILFVLGPGALLNSNIFEEYLSTIYCETLDDSRIYMIPSSVFVELMNQDFQLTKNAMCTQERKVWRLSHQLKNTMSSVYLERKLTAKLWKLARDFGIKTEEGIEIDINMTITFLADMLGVSRETTSRTCAVLVENNLIKMKKKRIIVTDPEKMANFYKTGKII